MKKLLILIVGLIALAALGWFAIYKLKAPAIQADIQKRSQEALVSNNLDWVTVSVDGRDLSLNGMAPTEQLKQHAVETANVYGVNRLSNNILVQSTSVAQEPEPDPIENAPIKSEVNPVDTTPDVKQVTAEPEQVEADVQVSSNELKTNAVPYRMNITRDDTGVYVFEGVVPGTEFKQEIDTHLLTLGIDPSKARWQVDVSSEAAPKNWQENAINSLSALQLLQEGSVSLGGDKAVVKGVAVSQDASDQAEAFAQSLASDFAETDVAFEVDSPKQVVKKIKPTPMVGSSKYAEKFCQTEFNNLLKQEKIQFESGSATLHEGSLLLLDKVSQVATRCADHQIQIHGYTDSNGAAAANKKLSKVRAEAVLSYLVSLGMSDKRLLAIGHGEARPIASNKTEKGRAKNRRIQLIVKGLKK